MRRLLRTPSPSMVVALIALLVALGGTGYAAFKVPKNSVGTKQLKNDAVTNHKLASGAVTVDKIAQGTVPKATNAQNAGALGGNPPAAFGSGVVTGGIVDPPNGANDYPPSGVFEPGDTSIEAVAPVQITIRDFVGEAFSGFNVSNETVAFRLFIGITATPLCTVSANQLTCNAAGPVTIPKGATYRVETLGANLTGTQVVGFNYRVAVG